MKSSISRNCLFSLILILAVSSCKKDEATTAYSNKYPVFVSLGTLSYAELGSALSQGTFVTLRPKTTDKGTQVIMSNGASTQPYTLSADDFRSFRFGLGGIIVGTNYMGEPLAYDLACSNCDRAEYRLTVNSNGTATCGHCHIVYSLNNYGFIDNTEHNTIHNEPRGLYRYHADINPAVVHVFN